MRILQLSAYFEPEQVSSSHLTNDLYTELAKNDIEIVDYVPAPCRGVSKEVRDKYKRIKYEEKYDGLYKVHRFSMFAEGKNPLIRAARYLLVNFIQFYKGIHEKNIDLIYSASTPPTQGLLCGMLKKRLKVPYVYNLQDIFPDSLVNAGMTSEGSIIWKIGRKIEDFTYNQADKIIVISQGFKRNIMQKGVPEEKIEVISNWIDLDSVHPVERKDNRLISEFGLDPNKFIVVYAGNFGAAQGADIVLKVAKELDEYEDIQFVIFGGGPYFMDAKNEAEGLKNVFIHELLPQERVSEVYSLGDVALITCKAGTGKAGMPSKTWSIMACNTPIIASFDTDSDLADVIKDSGSGVVIEPEQTDSIINEILNTYQNKDKYTRINSRNYVYQNASKEQCTKKYLEVIQMVKR